MNYVLKPLSLEELKSFFDENALQVIGYFLKKSIIAQPEKLPGQNDLPIQIPKEHIEQWVVQALGAKPIGAGSYPIDVLGSNWGADVKMLSCQIDNNGKLKNADSGETSLAQKFNDDNFGDNNTLDGLFKKKEYELIWNKWKDILIKKYKKVKDEQKTTNIYYFFILRAGLKFYLCALKLNLENLKQTTINEERSTNSSIWIKNFIDDNLGHVKIYKSKKRLELRLKPKKWVEEKLVISFDSNFEQISVNIREKVINNSLSDYIDKYLIPILK